nr:hypothetical protein [Rhizobiaceae bacterium]
ADAAGRAEDDGMAAGRKCGKHEGMPGLEHPFNTRAQCARFMMMMAPRRLAMLLAEALDFDALNKCPRVKVTTQNMRDRSVTEAHGLGIGCKGEGECLFGLKRTAGRLAGCVELAGK